MTDQKRLGDKSLWEIISWLDDCSSLVRPSIVWIYWLQSPLYLLCNSYGLMLSAQFYGFPWLVFWVMPLWPYDGPPVLLNLFTQRPIKVSLHWLLLPLRWSLDIRLRVYEEPAFCPGHQTVSLDVWHNGLHIQCLEEIEHSLCASGFHVECYMDIAKMEYIGRWGSAYIAGCGISGESSPMQSIE